MARSLWRRAERVALGGVFTVAAWIVERRVLRAIRRRGQSPPSPSLGEQTSSEIERPR